MGAIANPSRGTVPATGRGGTARLARTPHEADVNAPWIEVPDAVADRHPLRPVRGWLILFGFWLVQPLVGFPFLAAADWNAPARHAGLPDWAPAAWNAALLLHAAIHVVLLVLYVRRHRGFRGLFLPLILLSTAAILLPDALLFRATAAPDAAGWRDYLSATVPFVLLFLAVDAAFAAAMWRSRRFRLVFERRVRPDDPVLPNAEPAGSLTDAR